MNIVAQQPVIEDEKWRWDEKFVDLEPDCLDRGKYAKFLTDYLSTFTNQSYVMNLNAEWGAGKTYFLKRWQETIKDTYPTAYVDAWKHDFDNEPLLTVISGIAKTLKASCPNVKAKQYQEDVLKSGGYLLSAVMDGTSINTRWLNFDIGKFREKLAQKRSENLLKKRLDLHDGKIQKIGEFKDKLKEWLNETIRYGNHKKPMFVFIDELDRCRPTYAIEMLEVIKHLFDINGLVFVVATNTDQLQHSVKAVYGGGFDANTYLRRFFYRTYKLREANLFSYISTHKIFIEHLSKKFINSCDEIIKLQNTTVVALVLENIANDADFDLRSTEQWLSQLHACYSNKEENKTFWVFTAIQLALHINNAFDERTWQSYIKNEDVESSMLRKMLSKNSFSFEVRFNPKHLSGNYRLNEDGFYSCTFNLDKEITKTINIKDVIVHLKAFENSKFAILTSEQKIDTRRRLAKYFNQKDMLNVDSQMFLEGISHYLFEKYQTDPSHYRDLVQMSADLR